MTYKEHSRIFNLKLKKYNIFYTRPASYFSKDAKVVIRCDFVSNNFILVAQEINLFLMVNGL